MSHPPPAHTSRPPPPQVNIVTVPPWARDEPPSPAPLIRPDLPAGSSDAVSTHTLHSQGESRWWSFTLPRHRPDHHRSLRDFLPSSPSLQSTSFYRKPSREKVPAPKRRPDLTLPLPLPDNTTQFTQHQVTSPGWDTPWTARASAQGPLRKRDTEASYFSQRPPADEERQQQPRPLSRRKQLRRFIFTNPYVPILFRVINIAFTTSALGMATQIRKIEKANHTMGAVGSSPTVVIIFAPLTLLHVMAAIYLEYFGRPVGLWQTSGKLAHTLSEVLFICAWSAALSLCFDNFFTSLIPCASESHISWYNEIPRPASNIPDLERSAGDQICQDQLSLIILVGIGLIAYCSNLIISLYRIFEKVKYQPHQQQRP